MIKFTEFLESEVNPDRKKIFTWNGISIIGTQHGRERIFQRLKLSYEKLADLFKMALSKTKLMSLTAGEYLFYSNSLRQGFVGALTHIGDIRLITFLPVGRQNPKPGTKKVFVEGVEYDIVDIIILD